MKTARKMIDATLENIRPRYDAQHPYSEARVQAILSHLRIAEDSYGDWDLPPVVVLEDDGNGHTVLDGHHRLEAASRLARHGHLTTIPAWVVSIDDYVALIDEEFGGSFPCRLADLRDYIACGDATANDVADHGDDVAAA